MLAAFRISRRPAAETHRAAVTVSAVVVLFLGSIDPAHAFHEGGPGFCEGCHFDARAARPGLHGSDPSSTCLRCHGAAGEDHAVLSPDGSTFTPGGDFFWLSARASVSRSSRHGHNVVAADYGLTPDETHLVGPGGRFPSASLACTSCHDPHLTTVGKSVFRLLAGAGYRTGGVTFDQGVPAAVAAAQWVETDSNHTAYGSGMSQWCANCHGDFAHAGGSSHPAGPAGRLNARVAGTYNAYVKSGDLRGGRSSAYLALVPFEQGIEDLSRLDPSSTSGPVPGFGNVMCLSCHRGHASAFDAIGRWNFETTFLAPPTPGDVNAYYGRDIAAEFGPYQRSLCNKCHGHD